MPTSSAFPRDLATDELICFPFLDGGSPEEAALVEAELHDRGVPAWLVRGLRVAAAPGLWYQLLDWDWGALGVYDVLLGYGLLLLVAAPFSGIGFGLVPGLGLLGLGLALLLVGWLGLKRRRVLRSK